MSAELHPILEPTTIKEMPDFVRSIAVCGQPILVCCRSVVLFWSTCAKRLDYDVQPEGSGSVVVGQGGVLGTTKEGIPLKVQY